MSGPTPRFERLGDGSKCPGPAEFIVYTRGGSSGLSEGRIAEIDVHLGECPQCQHRLEVAARCDSIELQCGIRLARERAAEPVGQATTIPFDPASSSGPTPRKSRTRGRKRPPTPVLPPPRITVEPSPRPPAPSPIVAYRKWVTALAAALLLSVVSFVGWRQAAKAGQLQEQLAAKEERLAEALRKLEASQGVGSRKVRPADPFREVFERGLKVSVQPDQKHPNRLILVLSEAIRLPYFSGLKVIWDERSEPQTVYFWHDLPLNPLLTHDYDPRPAGAPAVAVTPTLVFYPTLEAREKLGLPEEMISRTFPLILTHGGIQLATPATDGGMMAKLLDPAAGAEVARQFRLSLSVQAPAASVTRSGRPQTDGVLHVLFRSRDLAGWKDRYFITPVRLRASDLPEGALESTVPVNLEVSLRGMLEGERVTHPVEVEVLLVELPLELRGWEVQQRLVPLDADLKPLVQDRRVLRLNPASE